MTSFLGSRTGRLDTDAYVGRPYECNGCYRLLRDVYLTELGIELNADGLFVVEEGWGSAIAGAKPEWIEVGSPQPFDAVLMLARRGATTPTHLGIYVGNGRVLHTRQKTGAVVESLEVLNRAGVVEGFYRYRRVNNAGLGRKAEDRSKAKRSDNYHHRTDS